MPAVFYIWLGVLAALLVLPLVVAIRTSRIRPVQAAALSRPDFDSAAAQRASESLAGAIRFQTVIRDGTPDTGEWVRLRDYLRSRYPMVHEKLAPEQVAGYSLVYHWKAPEPGKLPLLFCAHMDVVPAEGHWEHGPFEGVIQDGYVWGRGALDCKHLMICLLEAAERLLEQGYVPERDIYLAFGHDEEIGGPEGARNIAKLFHQRGLRFAMVLDEGGALARAPIATGRPVAEVSVAEKGMVNLRMTVRGEPGHASTPPRHTALGKMSEAVARMEFRRSKARLTPVVLDTLKLLAPFFPYKLRMYIANLWLFRRPLLNLLAADPRSNALIRTTVAATMATCGTAPNVLPESAQAVFNARLLHGDDEAALLSYLCDVTHDLEAEFELLYASEPSAVADYGGAAFHTLSDSIRNVFGEVAVVPYLMTGGTDARYYEGLSDSVLRFCPFILTPDDQATIHSVDERVMCDALGVAVRFYEDLIKRF